MASKEREAKVRFTAETGEFNAALKQVDANMRNLRSELKLNSAQMAASGESAELLAARKEILGRQAAQLALREEALAGKLRAAEAIYGSSSAEAQRLSAQLNGVRAAQELVRGRVEQTNAAIARHNQAEVQAQSAIGRLTSSIAAQQAELAQLQQRYASAIIETGRVGDEARQLESQIRSLNAELGQNRSRLSEATSAAQRLTGDERELRSAVRSAGDGFTVANGALANFAAQGAQMALDKARELSSELVTLGMDFESSMAKVQALTGSGADDMERLEAKARELGGSTRFTATQVSDAFGYMALAGWGTEDMLNGVNGVLNLSAAADMDLAEASDIVTDYLTAFGLSASDSAGFVDQMTYAMANSNTNVTQLGDAYKNCAATASSMHYSVEDTTAALMTMADAGVKGGEAGTTLNALMTRLATDTKGCSTELAKYGVQVYDSNGKMQSLSSILQGTSRVWGTLTDKQQANLGKMIAGTNQYSGFQTVMKGLGDQAVESGKSFTDYSSALESASGTAQGMSDVMMDTLEGDVLTMQSSFQELGLKVYDGVESPLRSAAQTITNEAIPALTGLVQASESGNIGGFLEGVDWAAEAQAALDGIGTAVAGVDWPSALSGAEEGIISAAGGVVTGIGQWLTANGGTILFEALKTIAYGIATTIANAPEILTAVGTLLNGVVDAIGGFAANIALAFAGLIVQAGTAAGEKAGELGASIGDKVVSGIRGIPGKAAGVFKGVADAIMGPINTAKERVGGAIDVIKGFFNFDFHWPHIPMPHFSVSPSGWKVGDLLKGSIPSLGVEWYAEGAVLNRPTVFGFNGLSAMIGGEAGPEAVSPISVLQSYIRNAVADGGGRGGDTYIVNGVTYDDGSNVASAVKQLIHATDIERRKRSA